MTSDRERRAAWVAFAAGALILLGGGTGSAALWLLFVDLAQENVPGIEPLALVATRVLPLVAGLGGLAVLAGAWLLRRGKGLPAMLLIEIGSGAGFLGILLALYGVLVLGNGSVPLLLGAFLGVAGLGVLLSLVARGMVVAPKIRKGLAKRVGNANRRR